IAANKLETDTEKMKVTGPGGSLRSGKNRNSRNSRRLEDLDAHARAREGGEETEGVAEHRKRSKLSDYATARRERPTKAGEYATARRQRSAKAVEIAERVASPTEQGSPVRPASDLRREHRNPVGKSASVEKTGEPGDSGESRRAFVSEPVAAPRRTVKRERVRVEWFQGEASRRAV